MPEIKEKPTFFLLVDGQSSPADQRVPIPWLIPQKSKIYNAVSVNLKLACSFTRSIVCWLKLFLIDAYGCKRVPTVLASTPNPHSVAPSHAHTTS